MSDSITKLRYMADQIARNFEALGHDNAVAATADHIATFWDPRMKAAILNDAEGPGHSPLSGIAAAAVEKLAAGAAPDPQTRATKFNAVDETGRSDGA